VIDVVDPKFGQKKGPFLVRWWPALKIKESQCPEPGRVIRPFLKAKVAVEAIKGHQTAAQIAQMFGIHPTQIGG
jgi:hypothetical protein